MSAGLYGPKEHPYREPFAESLADDGNFRAWVFERLGLGAFAVSARCLREEQRALRPSAKFWWKNNYCHENRCRCPGLAGREIDVLATFENHEGRRIGLHVECKHPKDRFSIGQAAGYATRASCWGPRGNNPPRVLPHDEALTLLICSRDDRNARSDVDAFDACLYFDEIAEYIPGYPVG